ncbi:MAG: preprotein translocase subunit SecA [Planctomycetota bacterium]|nr:MAG: preprotein translocase subunit SecA [Planctomycetota bacterium]
MEFLETLGDWFNAFLAWCERKITNLFGSSNERRVRQIGFVREKDGTSRVIPGSVLDRINSLEPEMEKKTDAELKESADRWRKQLADGKTLDELLPEVFAAVREVSKRQLKMRHYDVQMVGGYVLHQGMIAEMVTGEGKTLVATLPATLNALVGKVHVVTVNDYLARRDMEWMGPVYLGLGLTVGAIQSSMDPWERKPHYACDITYGTNNEFGFDYLRDNMRISKEHQVQGPLDFAIIDEIDNILIDEARTPLIISGPTDDDVTKYVRADQIARQLQPGIHFEIKEKERTCHLTEEGIRRAEELAGVESFYTAGNMEWPHLIDNALKARHIFKRDVDYVVENGQVIIVDEHTGRKMPGRQWSDGLHQAVEAKEGVPIKQETQTVATITLQNFFKLYKKLAGMTGTAMTEAEEFWKIYKLDVVGVPTNRPLRRINHPDVIFRTEREKWEAVVEEIVREHATGRPILVGTVSIEKSERLARMLDKRGIKYNLLNAKHHEREAEIVAQAGRLGAVTISTNMAGRGTDIILGGNPEYLAWQELSRKYASRLEVPKAEWDEVTRKIAEREGMVAEGRKVAELGGLHVIGTERHDSRRIDLQLRGRAGRQGDPGSSRFFVSLEDDLLRKFGGEWVKNMLTRLGMQEGECIENRFITRRIEAAQKKVEEWHFEQRKHLLEYDEVMDEQRKRVYSFRQRILEGANCRDLILDMSDRLVERNGARLLNPDYRWEAIAAWVSRALHIEIDPTDIRDMDFEQLAQYLREEGERQAEAMVEEKIEEDLPEDVEDQREWNWQALARWANAQWGLNLSDRDLKRVGREGMFDFLMERARKAIERWDLEPLKEFLRPDYQRAVFSRWLNQQFDLKTTPEMFDQEEDVDAIEHAKKLVREHYREKEVAFPVTAALNSYSINGQLVRDRLAQWARSRFEADVDEEEFERRPSRELYELLLDVSRRFLERAPAHGDLESRIERAFGNGDGDGRLRRLAADETEREEALRQLAEWANSEYKSQLSPDDFRRLSREQAREKLLNLHDSRYRPEMAHIERLILLEILDNAWKDHLYYMDHLRSGIGLVGYAQKDPKVEYKREGMRAFEQMWERVEEQVTAIVSRVEVQSPELTESVFRISAATHESAPLGGDYDVGDTSGPQPGEPVQAVQPIRNRGPKVGRNDPCPCGSGKKYKKCHGRVA